MSSQNFALIAPQQARSELSTSRLLDAAAELIAEVGYERMTLAAIGKRAGYSHGLVTRRFGSKEGLMWALVEKMTLGWFVTYIHPVIDEQAGRPALHARVDGIRASWKRSMRRMRAMYSLMFEALQPIPMLRDRMADLHRQARASVYDAVERGIEDGSVDASVDPDGVARLLTGAIRGAAYQAMLDPDGVDIFDALDDIDRMIDAIVVPPAKRKRARS